MRRRAAGLRPAALLVATVALLGSATSAGFSRYVVRPGDSLGVIAARAGVDVAELSALNALADPNRIDVGQVLRVPDGSTGSAPAPAGPGPTATAGPSSLLHWPARSGLAPLFRQWSAASGVPAGLLEALAWMESGWQDAVVSPTGAIGVCQVEPATARFVSVAILGLHQTLDARVPSANIRLGAAYLGWLLRASGGNVDLALAGYYQGPASARHRVLPETRRYVTTVRELWSVFGSG